jgi:hypothetical protein
VVLVDLVGLDLQLHLVVLVVLVYQLGPVDLVHQLDLEVLADLDLQLHLVDLVVLVDL